LCRHTVLKDECFGPNLTGKLQERKVSEQQKFQEINLDLIDPIMFEQSRPNKNYHLAAKSLIDALYDMGFEITLSPEASKIYALANNGKPRPIKEMAHPKAQIKIGFYKPHSNDIKNSIANEQEYNENPNLMFMNDCPLTALQLTSMVPKAKDTVLVHSDGVQGKMVVKVKHHNPQTMHWDDVSPLLPMVKAKNIRPS